MTRVQIALSSAACAGQLALALVALRRTAESRLALPLSLLFIDVFTWNLAALLSELSRQPIFAWLDYSASPLTAPLALHFVLAFVGESRRFARLRLLSWIPFAALSSVPTIGLFVPRVHSWHHSGGWAAVLAICSLPAMAFAVIRLVAHLRSSADLHERARTRLVLVAVALGTVMGLTDLSGWFLRDAPSLADIGFLAAGTLTLVATMRERLLESDVTLESVALAVAIAVAAVLGYLGLFRLLASHAMLLLLALGALTLALVAVVQKLSGAAARQRERGVQLALLGRMVAQMAHDIKNPLAALKGAAQYLDQEMKGEPGRRPEFVRLMLEQIARLEGAVDGYQRLARVEPVRAKLQLNDVVREVMALQGFAASDRIALRTELAEGLPEVKGDDDLLGAALQNLLRNACQAIGDGPGSVTVRTAAQPPGVVLSVEDTGPGMDARTREQAFDEFFTTKAGGSGLGLSFVRRVVAAHGGGVSIASESGRGTVVSIRLPLG